MNWLTIAVLTMLILFAFIGYKRGLIKKVVSLLSLIITLILVSFLTPYISQFIQERTPIYKSIKEQCLESIEGQLSAMESNTKSAQVEFINQLALPDSIKNSMIENNNADVYASLAVDQFSDYIAGYLAKWIVNAMSYIVSFVLIIIFLRFAFMTLDIVARLPIINGINKIAGLVVGLVEGVLIMWILFITLTIFINTPIGQSGFAMINESSILTFLYNNNYLLKIITSVFVMY